MLDSGAIKRARCAHAVIIPRLREIKVCAAPWIRPRKSQSFAGEGAPYVLDSGAIKRARCAHAVIIPRLLYQEQEWLVFSAQK